MNNNKTSKRRFRITFFISMSLLMLLSCQNGGHDNIGSRGNYSKKIVVAKLSFNRQTGIVKYELRNQSSRSYYLPRNPRMSYFGDTLYLEAVFKKRKTTDHDIIYNQFNPPVLDEFKSNSLAKGEVFVKKITSETPQFLAVRFYEIPYPFNPKKDYQKYYSLKSFLEYDLMNSFLLTFFMPEKDN